MKLNKVVEGNISKFEEQLSKQLVEDLIDNFGASFDEEISGYKSRVKDLSGTVSALSKTVAETSQKAKNLASELEKVTVSYTSNKDEIKNAFFSEISALSKKLDSDIGDMKNSVADIDTAIGELKKKQDDNVKTMESAFDRKSDDITKKLVSALQKNEMVIKASLSLGIVNFICIIVLIILRFMA